MNRGILIMFVGEIAHDFWLGHFQSTPGKLYNGRTETTSIASFLLLPSRQSPVQYSCKEFEVVFPFAVFFGKLRFSSRKDLLSPIDYCVELLHHPEAHIYMRTYLNYFS